MTAAKGIALAERRPRQTPIAVPEVARFPVLSPIVKRASRVIRATVIANPAINGRDGGKQTSGLPRLRGNVLLYRRGLGKGKHTLGDRMIVIPRHLWRTRLMEAMGPRKRWASQFLKFWCMGRDGFALPFQGKDGSTQTVFVLDCK